MKKSGLVLLGLLSTLAAQAQEPAVDSTEPAAELAASAEPAAEVVPVEDVAPMEANAAAADASNESVAEATVTEDVSADAGSTTESTEVTETVAVEETTSESSDTATESKPRMFYVGADIGRATVSVSNLDGFDKADTETDLFRGRVGMRLLEGVGVEVQVAVAKDDDTPPTRGRLDAAYGLYFVPTGVLLDMVEFAFPLGYAFTKVQNDGHSENLNSPSYGVNVEFPLRVVSEGLPDIRIGAGGMVYQQDNSARAYSFHAGLRFDFGV